MSAKTIEAGRIAGALKGLEALRRLGRSTECAAPCQTIGEFEELRLFDARALVSSLGPMTPEQEGVVAVLAEYIATEIAGSTPNISPGAWSPLSTMTAEERRAMYERLDAEHAADNLVIEQRQKALRKVVSIADRMPAR